MWPWNITTDCDKGQGESSMLGAFEKISHPRIRVMGCLIEKTVNQKVIIYFLEESRLTGSRVQTEEFSDSGSYHYSWIYAGPTICVSASECPHVKVWITWVRTVRVWSFWKLDSCTMSWQKMARRRVSVQQRRTAIMVGTISSSLLTPFSAKPT